MKYVIFNIIIQDLKSKIHHKCKYGYAFGLSIFYDNFSIVMHEIGYF
jgi:hypothetical protein